MLRAAGVLPSPSLLAQSRLHVTPAAIFMAVTGLLEILCGGILFVDVTLRPAWAIRTAFSPYIACAVSSASDLDMLSEVAPVTIWSRIQFGVEVPTRPNWP